MTIYEYIDRFSLIYGTEWLLVHNQKLRDPKTRKIPLSAHLDVYSRDGPKYSIFPSYKIKTIDIMWRKMKEMYFIDIFKSKLNKQ